MILLSQPQGQSLDKIVVSVPLTPAHGAVARSPNQVKITTCIDQLTKTLRLQQMILSMIDQSVEMLFV